MRIVRRRKKNHLFVDTISLAECRKLLPRLIAATLKLNRIESPLPPLKYLKADFPSLVFILLHSHCRHLDHFSRAKLYRKHQLQAANEILLNSWKNVENREIKLRIDQFLYQNSRMKKGSIRNERLIGRNLKLLAGNRVTTVEWERTREVRTFIIGF